MNERKLISEEKKEGLKEDSKDLEFPIEFFIERGEKLLKNVRG